MEVHGIGAEVKLLSGCHFEHLPYVVFGFSQPK